MKMDPSGGYPVWTRFYSIAPATVVQYWWVDTDGFIHEVLTPAAAETGDVPHITGDHEQFKKLVADGYLIAIAP